MGRRKVHPEKAKLGEIAYKNDHYIPSQTPYIPTDIVNTFEKHDFIWGGKWNDYDTMLRYYATILCYDTMHFEYRPELSQEVYSISCK
ncbi:MAG: M15 family metallopeptidase [Bdellovibrionaceae bacterium]|nr:M15 family metallopeptidase [Pseudobdellovibrionaceae bacterium]